MISNSKKETTFKRFKASFFTNKKVLQLLVFVFAIVVFANSLGNDYAQDDAIVITDNMFVKQGVKGIPGILQYDTFYGFFKKEGKAKLVAGGRYRPFSLITFALENQFFGLNPFVGHLINIILFGIIGVLLFRFVDFLVKDSKVDFLKLYFPFIVSLLFVAHPIHTEVVDNIKGRDEIFSLLFSLGALLTTLKYRTKIGLKSQISILVLFLLALFSKENAITIVVVVPLILYLFYNDKISKIFRVIMPFLVASIIFLAVRISILGFDFGGYSNELMNNPFIKLEGNKYIPFDFGEKLATIIFTMGKYLQLLIFPHPLTNDYYPRHIDIMSIGDWRVLLSLFLYIAIFFIAFKYLKKFKLVSFGILFFIITISIVSNLIFPVGTNMSERFLFMPSVGFSIISGYLVYWLSKYNFKLSISFVSLVLVLYSVKTISRNTVWKNDFTLFTTDVKVSGNSAKALNAAGGSLVTAASKEKNALKKNKMLKEAKKYLQKAIDIHPTYNNAFLLLGNAHYYSGEYEESVQTFEKLLKIEPNYPEAYKNLRIAYRSAGKYYGEEKNNLKKALFFLKKAYQMSQDDYETLRLYGIANALSENYDMAIKLFQKAVEIEPNNPGAYINLGNAYYNSGDKENGIKYRAKGSQLKTEN